MGNTKTITSVGGFMKKVAFIVSALVFLMAGAAFADYEAGPKTLGSTETLVVQLSNSVQMDYIADTTTNGLGYIVGASHTSGTRSYGSSSGDSSIFWIDGVKKALPTTVPTGTGSADFSSWDAL